MAQTKVQLLQPNLGDVIDFDSSTLFMDGTDNRVGIRNTNPQYELDVTGTVKATNFIGAGSTTIADWIIHDGDTDTKFGFSANDTFTVQTAGTPRLNVTSAGQLVVGGSAYADTGSFSVSTNGEFRAILPQSTASSTMLGAIGGASNGFNIVTDSSNGQTYKFHNGSAQAVTITDNGRIYIGHTSSGTYDGIQPQVQLEGTNYNTSSMSLFCNSNDSANAPQLQLGKSRHGSDGGATAVQNGDRVGSIYGVVADGTDRNSSVASIQFYVDGTVASNTTPGSIRFATTKTTSGSSTPTERLRIDSDGRLLVNGAVAGNAFVGGDDLIIGNTGTGARGGITLVSNSSQDGGIYFSKGTSSNSDYVKGQIVYAHDNGSNSGDALRFYTAGTEKLRIASTGQVMIGHGGFNKNANAGADDLIVGKTSGTDSHGITIKSPTNKYGRLYFADADSSPAWHVGQIEYNHSNDDFTIYTGGNPRQTWNSSGITLTQNGVTGGLTMNCNSNNAMVITANTDRGSHTATLLSLKAKWNSTEVCMIDMQAGDDTTNKDNGQIAFYTAAAGTNKQCALWDEEGRTHLGDWTDQGTTYGKALVNIRGEDEIATSFSLANSYLHLGGFESTMNGLYPISFGHTKADSTKASSYIAAKVTDSGAYEKTDLLFATRDATTDSDPTVRLTIDKTGDITANTGNLRFTAANKALYFNDKFYFQDTNNNNRMRLWIDSNSSGVTKGATWITGVGNRGSVGNLDENHAGLLVFPSASDGINDYSDRHMITFSQPQHSWYEPTGNHDSSFGLLWHYVASNNAQNRCGIVYDHHNTEEWRFYNSYGPTSFYTYPGTSSQGDRTVNQCTEALRICKSGVVSINANPTNNFGGSSKGQNNVSTNNCRLNVHGGIRVTDYSSRGQHANNASNDLSAAIYDPLNPANFDRGQNDQGDAYFTMGWKKTARSGEQMHRKTDGTLYKKPGGTDVHAYYIEAGCGEAGGICLDEDSVNVYGSSDNGTTFRIIDKDSDIVAAEMVHTSWNWNVRGNAVSGASVSSISDRRLKKSIQDATPTTGILSKFGQIKLKSFIRIDQYDYVKKKYTNEEDLREIGVIAQEVESIFPDCVGESKNIDKRSYKSVYEELGLTGDDQFDNIKNVNVNGIMYKTIEAIQELIKENESFKSRITALES